MELCKSLSLQLTATLMHYWWILTLWLLASMPVKSFNNEVHSLIASVRFESEVEHTDSSMRWRFGAWGQCQCLLNLTSRQTVLMLVSGMCDFVFLFCYLYLFTTCIVIIGYVCLYQLGCHIVSWHLPPECARMGGYALLVCVANVHSEK